MRLIFLDIDGVLNSPQSQAYYRRKLKKSQLWKEPWCPIAVSNLLVILEQFPDIRIVISSSWRMKMDEVEEHFLEAGLPWDRVIGKTPRIHGMDPETGEYLVRGHEIQAWLKEHATPGHLMLPEYDVEDFVILDDGSDMAMFTESNLYQTEYETGLSWLTVLEILRRFKKPLELEIA